MPEIKIADKNQTKAINKKLLKQAKQIEQITEQAKSKISITVVPKANIPKLQRRHTGIYAEISEKLKELDGSDAIVLTVATRPTAAGIQKYFKPLGYDVVSRTEKNGDKTEIRVYLSKTEKEK